MQHYERVGITGFGKLLFSSGDLDPVYTSLIKMRLEQDQLCRFLIAYWLFYHCGYSSLASEHEGADFWKISLTAAKNVAVAPSGGRWPRGAERRHFRGRAAVDAVVALRKRYGNRPEDMVDYISTGPMNVRSVIERATTHKLFGPWIGFKVADMLDAVMHRKVEQDDVSVFLYDTPRQSIIENLPKLRINHKGSEEEQLERAMIWLQKELEDCRIPHKPKQRPDLFSLETVWCKHLSHMHGHYPFFKDINEIRHGLEPWLASKTAQSFLSSMPLAPTLPCVAPTLPCAQDSLFA